MSTSIEASASTALVGFIWSMNGHAASADADGAHGPRRDVEKVAPRRFGRRRICHGFTFWNAGAPGGGRNAGAPPPELRRARNRGRKIESWISEGLAAR